MIPVPQRILGSRDGPVRGDCVKVCVASLLELPYEAVPHFVAGEPYGPKDWFSALSQWMKEGGWPIRPASVSYLRDEYDGTGEAFVYESRPRGHHQGWWMASVRSKLFPGSDHMLVMHGGTVAFDPSPHAQDHDYQAKPYEYNGETWFWAPEPWVAGPGVGGDPGYPTGHEMIRQLREALGMFDGAIPLSPQRVWEDALAEARRRAAPGT